MTVRQLLALLLLLPSLAIASSPAHHLQTIRIQAFTVCSNLLVYYNPNQGGSDPKHAERYRQGIHTLQKLLETEPDQQLAMIVADMQESISELESQPASNAQLYPIWINPLLKAQAHFDQQVAARYAALPAIQPQSKALHRLSLDVARLLLLYETRTFRSLAVYVVEMDDHTFGHLDRQILQGFTDLAGQWPQQAEELGRLKRKYDFIRPRLLQYDLGWVPGSAALYLGQITEGLNRLDVQ